MIDNTILKLAFLAVALTVLYKLFVAGAPVVDTEDVEEEDDAATDEAEVETYTPMEAVSVDEPAGTMSDATMIARGVSSDLIPQITANAGFEYGPDPNVLAGKNFLDGSRWTGINTVAGSLRNANRQLRADPIIPKNMGVSPWNVSTIEEDLARRPLE